MPASLPFLVIHLARGALYGLSTVFQLDCLENGHPPAHYPSGLGAAFHFFQRLAPRPVLVFRQYKYLSQRRQPPVTAPVMPQALRPGDGGACRSFSSMFQDPMEGTDGFFYHIYSERGHYFERDCELYSSRARARKPPDPRREGDSDTVTPCLGTLSARFFLQRRCRCFLSGVARWSCSFIFLLWFRARLVLLIPVTHCRTLHTHDTTWGLTLTLPHSMWSLLTGK